MAVSPDLGPVVYPLAPVSAPLSALQDASSQPLQQHEPLQQQPSSSRGDFLNQIESLLAAATAFEKRPLDEINAISCAESDATASTNNSEHNSLCFEEEETEKEDIGSVSPLAVATVRHGERWSVRGRSVVLGWREVPREKGEGCKKAIPGTPVTENKSRRSEEDSGLPR